MIPQGFRFASTYAGIRKLPDDDLALMVSDVPASAAGVFTKNQVCAAPVMVSKQHLKESEGTCRAVVVNAGNANCSTTTMNQVVKATVDKTARLIGAPTNQILVASTGVIGEPLDETLILNALPDLTSTLSPTGFEDSAAAIMTTDTYPKSVSTQIKTSVGVVRLAGMAKGAGMIQPDMATMLAFLFTDAGISAIDLQKMLEIAVDQSFNRISVDGDTSTNDTVLLLANGASGKMLTGSDQLCLQDALNDLSTELAVGIVGDGEGSQKVITIEIDGTATNRQAVQLARSIANSPLVKTAFAGADPNWGRILASAGASGVSFEPKKVDMYLNGHLICCSGVRSEFSEKEVQLMMELDELTLRFHIRGGGKGQARFWTCDFTKEYIDINAEYRT